MKFHNIFLITLLIVTPSTFAGEFGRGVDYIKYISDANTENGLIAKPHNSR